MAQKKRFFFDVDGAIGAPVFFIIRVYTTEPLILVYALEGSAPITFQFEYLDFQDLI